MFVNAFPLMGECLRIFFINLNFLYKNQNKRTKYFTQFYNQLNLKYSKCFHLKIDKPKLNSFNLYQCTVTPYITRTRQSGYRTISSFNISMSKIISKTSSIFLRLHQYFYTRKVER